MLSLPEFVSQPKTDIEVTLNSAYVSDALDFLSCPSLPPFDLIYIDPPYHTNRTHTLPPRPSPMTPRKGTDPLADGAPHTFADSWPTRAAYLDWLSPRLAAIHRALSPTGLLIVHLDWHAVHYVKVLLDGIFGDAAMVNELIWYYQTGGASKDRFSRKHDTLLLYAKGERHYFDGRSIAIPRTEKAMKRARSGKGARIAATDTHKNPDDVLLIPALNPMSKERTGYPTQKPLQLLETLITALCPPGGLVGDVFCGSGTTLLAAKRLGRNYLGCDVSPAAAELAIRRLGG